MKIQLKLFNFPCFQVSLRFPGVPQGEAGLPATRVWEWNADFETGDRWGQGERMNMATFLTRASPRGVYFQVRSIFKDKKMDVVRLINLRLGSELETDVSIQ